MSEENVELVRNAYDAYNRGDMEAMADDVAPEFEYVAMGAIPDIPAVFRGPEAWSQFSAWLREEFNDARVDVHELTDAGDRVLAEVSLRGRGKQSGLETTWNIWHVWTLRDGKVVHGQGFEHRADALEAAGLSE
jgi:ketosteroid isomerase-like protein